MYLLRGNKLRLSKIFKPRKAVVHFIIINLFLSLFLIAGFIYDNNLSEGAPIPEQEPNDSFSEAMPISQNTYSGSVNDPDFEDYFEITLAAGQTLSIKYNTSQFGTKTALVLFNGAKEELFNKSWIDPDTIIFVNYTINRTIVNPYYIVIRAETTGNEYNLAISIRSQNDANSGTDGGDIISDATPISVGTSPGYLGDEDISDFYKFVVPDGGIINLNLSVSSNSTGSIDFDIYSNETTIVKSIVGIQPGKNQMFRFTINSSGPRSFYINAKLAQNENNYTISLDITRQDDATSMGDAGNNISSAVLLSTSEAPYRGWLGGGAIGYDLKDLYEIELPATNQNISVNITITPASNLDLVINLYNDTFALVKYINPLKGMLVYINYTTVPSPLMYFELKVDPGKNSDGDYTVSFKITTHGGAGADTDKDGMPDSWEEKYGFNPNDSSDAELDADEDGANNLKEYISGSDPKNSDSDGDGMPDGWEIDNSLDLVTDNKNSDADSDGYTDFQEFKNHTDPNNPSSHPLAGYDHLTTEVCKRDYVDNRKDVRFWEGNIDNVSKLGNIQNSKVGDYPPYDLLSLSSNRIDNELVVKLKVLGKVHDTGDLESEGNDSENGEITIYWVGFVDNTFSEPKSDETTISNFVNFWDDTIKFPLIYFNNTFIGTPTTKGQKLDNGQTIEWRVPLAEIAELKNDFELYGIVTHNKIMKNEAEENFEIHFDSLGTGSLDQGGEGPDATVPIKKIIVIDEHEISVFIDADGPGGIIQIEKAEKPDTELPKDAGDLGLFIDIELTGNVQATNIFLTMEYKDSDIPEGFNEKDVKFFYYDETDDSWVKVSNSGVWTNNNTGWARPSHLTIFAPMAKPDSKEEEPSDIMFYLMVIVIIIVVIIIIAVGMVIVRSSKKARRPPERPPSGPRRALTPEFFKCPRCGEEIEIPYSETQRVALECHHCGGRGKIDNPYLKKRGPKDSDRDRARRDEDYERDYERRHRRGEDIDLEYRPPPGRRREREEHRDRVREPKPEDDYEYKKCPKCGERIPIPYEEDEKVIIHCPKCGAKGKVKNPYLS